jgi:hypothetical protein
MSEWVITFVLNGIDLLKVVLSYYYYLLKYLIQVIWSKILLILNFKYNYFSF